MFAYGVFADRLTPYTDQATVQAYVVRVAPDISGRVKTVNVADNQAARTGQTLFTLDPERYEIAVESAEAQLATAGLEVGASTAGLAASEANLAEAQANLTNAREQSKRTFDLVRRGFEAKSQGDRAQAALDSAIAAVGQAVAEVERAEQNLGPRGAGNPQIRQAQATLRKARRDLADTIVRAPSNGVVTNRQLATGQYVNAGQPVMTFFDSSAIWVESEMEENALEHIEVGDPVGIALDIRPGRVYRGRVESVGWGVDSREIDSQTGLPTIRNDSGWVREPQRFAVRVRFEPDDRPRGIRVGSQANVVVFTGKNPVTDVIGRLWIGLVSYLSYLT
ncbi:HlyD family secretion protein [Phenylobacterium sp.]|nr:HlyD family secretion protein [Phenylobacterium sp.]